MNLQGEHRPVVVAHRGSSGTAPENTMAAFRCGVSAGADMIEFDVRMTQDFELVVHHDRRLGRTSDGTGRICELSLSDLRTVDAGTWFGRRFAGERIPTLREVLTKIPLSVGMNIEVKTDGNRRNRVRLADALLLAIREARRGDTVLVSSFDHTFLRRLHYLDPSMLLGVLYLAIRDGLWTPSRIAYRAGASVFICSRAQIRSRLVRDAHVHAVSVAVYGVNTTRDLERVVRAGVDAVITDYPARIVRALGSV